MSDINSSIVAGNDASEGPEVYGVLTSKGYNLVQDTSACTIAGDTTGNIIGQDPLLGPLRDNGGPTETHALLLGSPAIDAGSCQDAGGNPVLTDQRGVARPQGAGCDIGAYELVPADAVPSVSEWGLIVMSSLLASVLVWKLRHGTRRGVA